MQSRYLEILDFTKFFDHFVFTPNEENILEKELKKGNSSKCWNRTGSGWYVKEAQNQLLLIGSADVVSCVLKFHDYAKLSNVEERKKSLDKHDILLTDIMKAMRKDLYRDKNINKGYPVIHLSGKNWIN